MTLSLGGWRVLENECGTLWPFSSSDCCAAWFRAQWVKSSAGQIQPTECHYEMKLALFWKIRIKFVCILTFFFKTGQLTLRQTLIRGFAVYMYKHLKWSSRLPQLVDTKYSVLCIVLII